MSSSSGSLLAWGAFIVGVCLLLAIDLGVFHRKPRRVGFREAGLWTAFWILLSLAFNGYVWQVYGEDKAFKFLNAYIIEKALSVDNIFVFIVIFRYMRIPVAYLHRVLYAGILGAIVLRGVFIVAGLGLVNTFSWTLYLFGLFLLYTGVRLLFVSEDDGENPGDNWVKRQAERWLPVTDDYEGARFFVRRHGRMFATTLFVTLLMIETADVVFALDSIPAIFGISTDPFIVFTSNICAIMGLRAMFFLLENVLEKLRFLNAGLGLVLAFIGVKMILELGLGPALQAIHIKPETSLAVVGAILLVSIVV
ncbi:MAG: TerC family protein, partial [Myxococcales bacterium]|nr:TerC family protein [Myxococcales bacterium]